MDVICKLAKDLKLDYKYIEKIVNRADYYYRDYTIPKRMVEREKFRSQAQN